MDRRRFLELNISLAAAAAAGIVPARAQADWPSKNITMIVPFTPGGSTDILARLIGQRFTEAWGQGVITEGTFDTAVALDRRLSDEMRAHGYPFHDPLYSLLFASGDFLPEIRLTPRGVFDVKSRTVLS